MACPHPYPQSHRHAPWRDRRAGGRLGRGVPTDLDLLARVAGASVLGEPIRLGGEQPGQVAGMRTHGLVACGAAIFTLAGAYGFADINRGPNVDPMRVA